MASNGQKPVELSLDLTGKSAPPTQTKPRFLRAYSGRYFFCNFGYVERLLQVFFELGRFGGDWLLGLEDAGQRVGGLQAVAGDAQHCRFLRQNAVLTIEFARGSYRDATGSFSEYAFGFSQQADRTHPPQFPEFPPPRPAFFS